MKQELIVEAALFASQTPLTVNDLAKADPELGAKAVRLALESLRQQYDTHERAFQIYQLGDGYQILTRPEFAPYLERFESIPRPPTLSRAALEALAIIAYRQPIRRIELEGIRGVASDHVLRTLQDWGLVAVVGRGEGLGRPLLYGTTSKFLDHFALQSLDDLPKPRDLPIALVQPDDEVGELRDEQEAGPEGGSADGDLSVTQD